jgi:hypothetical protein
VETQDDDGSWGAGPAVLEGHALGKDGLTGLGVLTLLDHMYSHLSKDEVRGRVVGETVKKGIRRLMADQLPDGRFAPSTGNVIDHALATLALTEAYGLTGSNLFKDSARKAVEALEAMQAEDGSFGDAASTAWAAEAFHSAEISDLAFGRKVYAGLIGYSATGKVDPADPARITVRRWVVKEPADPATDPTIGAILSRGPDLSRGDFARAYRSAQALRYAVDDPKSRAWRHSLRQALHAEESKRGAWLGRTRGETVLRTCLAGRVYALEYRPCPQLTSK